MPHYSEELSKQGLSQTERKPCPNALQDLVTRVVEVAHPRRILLFGSAAREEMGPGSDLDILVIVEGPVHRRTLAGKIYRNLPGVPFAVDVVVATTRDIRDYGHKNETILPSALKEGIVLYEA